MNLSDRARQRRHDAGRSGSARPKSNASWIVTLKTRDVHDIAVKYLNKPLQFAFRERFGTTLPDTLNESHTMAIIASAFDPSSQRIVRYLSETHGIVINTAFLLSLRMTAKPFLRPIGFSINQKSPSDQKLRLK